MIVKCLQCRLDQELKSKILHPRFLLYYGFGALVAIDDIADIQDEKQKQQCKKGALVVPEILIKIKLSTLILAGLQNRENLC